MVDLSPGIFSAKGQLVNAPPPRKRKMGVTMEAFHGHHESKEFLLGQAFLKNVISTRHRSHVVGTFLNHFGMSGFRQTNLQQPDLPNL